MCNNYSKTQEYFKHLHWQKNTNINKCMHIIIMQILFPHHPFQMLGCIQKLETSGFLKI